jgi:hypothetical protein
VERPLYFAVALALALALAVAFAVAVALVVALASRYAKASALASMASQRTGGFSPWGMPLALKHTNAQQHSPSAKKRR